MGRGVEILCFSTAIDNEVFAILVLLKPGSRDHKPLLGILDRDLPPPLGSSLIN
jgi:hypothetical protein